MDRPQSAHHLAELQASLPSVTVIPISARTGDGITELTAALRAIIEKHDARPEIEVDHKKQLQAFLFEPQNKRK